MEKFLVSGRIIQDNLRRTSNKGLFSCLSKEQLNCLALKYFGIYENNKLVGYECPYSGKNITNINDLVLEHIIPVSSGGGTTLFNCIPTSSEVNSTSEKGTKHLISWWLNSKYWDSSAPIRLEKIIKYMLEAYEITFINDNEVSDYIDFFDDNEINNDLQSQKCDLSNTQEEQFINSTSFITYYSFINDLINELQKYKDVTFYHIKLQNLINQNIFENIERQTLIQKLLKNIIKDKLELEDRSELTLALNINISMLTKSLENISDDDLYDELEQRIDNINVILQNHNLSLNSFFLDKSSIIYLYKNIKDLSNEDIDQLIKNINICVADKFNAMTQFVEYNEGKLPNNISNNRQEKKLGSFKNRIQTINKKYKQFKITLTREQLEYLHNSEYEKLRELYKIILYKAILNNIDIAFIDYELASKIKEYIEKNKAVNSLEERIELEKEYSNYIVIESQFNQFINFILTNKGKLPNNNSNNKQEKKLGSFKTCIQHVSKQSGKFSTLLTKEQLEYLHNSQYDNLKKIYKVILYKATLNNIKINFVDYDMVSKIKEYIEKRKVTKSIEEQIKLENQYSDYIIIDSQFNQFISFVLTNNGKLPNSASNDEQEKKLARFNMCIQTVNKRNGKFSTSLTKEQLEYLHNSQYDSLKKIYKAILYKATLNNIENSFVDYDMVLKIKEYNEKRKSANSIEEQIKLEQEYSSYIIITNRFNQFINYVLTNNGKLPSNESDNEQEKKLGQFRSSIQSIAKKSGMFHSTLTKEQLKYLHNSKYDGLNKIYNFILYKAILNDIEIAFVDDELALKIKEYIVKRENIDSIDEQIKLEQEYSNCIIITNKFNQFINFVLTNNGKFPNYDSNNEQEKKLRQFISSIQTISKKSGIFNCTLTKEQLEYLHNSEHENLRELYKIILYKAISNNIEIDYIDNELAAKIKEFNEKIKIANSIEEKMKLEIEYADYIVIDSQFNQFINFVLTNNGKLPNNNPNDEKEKKLAGFRFSIQQLNKRADKFSTSLEKEQLEFLHSSEYRKLRDLYKVILYKAILNNIEIDFIDIELAAKIKEFNKKIKIANSIEEKIELEKQYSDYIVIDNPFNQFINFVLTNNGKLPNNNSDNEQEKQLAKFRSSIQNVEKQHGKFHSKLTKEQLEYLHNSKYKNLRELYKVILYKAIINNIEIDFVDYELASKINEYNEKVKMANSIEEKIKLEKNYSNYIVIENLFNQFINFVLTNNGKLPNFNADNKQEKQLARFRSSIQSVDKKPVNFHFILTSEQLEYLHNSEYDNLKKIYNTIIEKAKVINYQPYLEIDKALTKNKHLYKKRSI